MPTLLDKAAWSLGAGFGTGLSPVAPGTAGSLLAVVIYAFLPISEDSLALYLMIGVGFLAGIWATGSLTSASDPDPRRAVWDEFIGMWATCIFLPKTVYWLAAAFFLFRILDIVKPFPVRRLEKLHGGLGIMADDLLAGLYGAALLNGLLRAFFD